jgi:hypothetical protein
VTCRSGSLVDQHHDTRGREQRVNVGEVVAVEITGRHSLWETSSCVPGPGVNRCPSPMFVVGDMLPRSSEGGSAVGGLDRSARGLTKGLPES